MPIAERLAELVRIPSVNPMGRSPIDPALHLEWRLTDHLEAFAKSIGIRYERHEVLPQRDNIVFHFDAQKPKRRVLFEVHQDTVPVDGMIVDPFAAEVRGGKLYGRGSCDVKGTMAVMLTVIERLHRESPANAADVTLACTVDEEHTFLGVQHLVKRLPKIDLAVVAEPSRLGIIDAHKGVTRWTVEAHGVACHSSRPELGKNAVYGMAHVLTATEHYARELQASVDVPRLGPPTISVGRIYGGVSVNTVPDSCVIEIDRRVLPGETAEGVVKHFADALKSACPNVDYTIRPTFLNCPALGNEIAELARSSLGRAIDAVRGSHEVYAVPFGTDASTLALAGIPTVVFGPGDIAQAHTKDEYIEVDQLEPAAEILYRLATAN